MVHDEDKGLFPELYLKDLKDVELGCIHQLIDCARAREVFVQFVHMCFLFRHEMPNDMKCNLHYAKRHEMPNDMKCQRT